MSKNFLIAPLAAFLILIVASCGMSQSRIADNVGPFNAIKVSTGIDLYLTQGSTEKVDIEASERDVEDLVVETRGNTLHVYFENNSWNMFRSRSAKVYVQAVNIRYIDCSSGSDVIGKGVIKSDELEIEASSGSDVRLEVSVGRLTLSSSSGSDISLSGTANTLSAQSSSGSDINAADLTVKNANLKSSSGSDIKVGVTEELTAKASSGAGITIIGSPSARNVDSSSGGSVRFR